MAAADSSASPEAKLREATLHALAAHVGGLQPLPLFGTKSQPGWFAGRGAKSKAMAALAQQTGWLRQVQPGDNAAAQANAPWELSPEGLYTVLSEGDTAIAVRSLLLSLDQTRQVVDGLTRQLEAQRRVVDRLYDSIVPPELTNLVFTGDPRSFHAESWPDMGSQAIDQPPEDA